MSAALRPGYRQLGTRDEQLRTFTFADSVRCAVAGPLLKTAFKPGEHERDTERDTQRVLVIYATPNGNTLEQTWGCQAQPNRDWHFDIQHVAAQMRALRQWTGTHTAAKREVWYAVIEAPQLSWPQYRAQYADSEQKIAGMIDFLVAESRCDEFILAAHSGGGAFILDSIEAHANLPDKLGQILFLDANYSYDDALHADKLIRWLKSSARHSLTILAYDDREITLNGNKVVSESGGTYRATQRIQKRFKQDMDFVEHRRHDFVFQTGLGEPTALYGQVSLAVHQNPENKILHTALVGEMNGLEAAIKLHWTRLEQLDKPVPSTEPTPHWPGLSGPRDYSDWIASEPITQAAFARPASDTTDRRSSELSRRIALPDRPTGAMTGSELARLLQDSSAAQVRAMIASEIAKGNVPDRCRQLVGIDVELLDDAFQLHTGRYFVMADYLSIGSNEACFRIPMHPATAWDISQLTNMSMITAKVADDIHACAPTRLKPQPLTEKRESVETFCLHHQMIEQQLSQVQAGATNREVGIISGIKKDLVLTSRLLARPHRVALYGWHNLDGVPIQPLYVGHVDHYIDYSHGVRLMAGQMLVDGQLRPVEDIMSDSKLCGLLSREGPIVPAEIARTSQWVPSEPPAEK